MTRPNPHQGIYDAALEVLRNESGFGDTPIRFDAIRKAVLAKNLFPSGPPLNFVMVLDRQLQKLRKAGLAYASSIGWYAAR